MLLSSLSSSLLVSFFSGMCLYYPEEKIYDFVVPDPKLPAGLIFLNRLLQDNVERFSWYMAISLRQQDFGSHAFLKLSQQKSSTSPASAQQRVWDGGGGEQLGRRKDFLEARPRQGLRHTYPENFVSPWISYTLFCKHLKASADGERPYPPLPDFLDS